MVKTRDVVLRVSKGYSRTFSPIQKLLQFLKINKRPPRLGWLTLMFVFSISERPFRVDKCVQLVPFPIQLLVFVTSVHDQLVPVAPLQSKYPSCSSLPKRAKSSCLVPTAESRVRIPILLIVDSSCTVPDHDSLCLAYHAHPPLKNNRC